MKTNKMTSEELYKGCIANNEDAWSYVFNYIISYLISMTGPSQDIEDISNDAIIYFMNGAIYEVRDPRAFKKLLRLKAMALFIDLERYKEQHPNEPIEYNNEEGHSLSDNPKIANKDTSENHITSLFLEKALKIVDHCLKSIDIECKNILEKYFWGKFRGDSVSSIAEEISIPYANFRTLVYRCHKKLLKQVEYKKLLDEYNY